MRFTIERIRAMVLAAAVLLLASLAVFLVAAKWRGRLRKIDLPQHLAREIQQESLNFDYTHNFGAHSKFRIHAAKAIQLKNDHIDLRGVEIDLYGPDGGDADRIKGDEFEYNQKSGVAIAAGPVEMLLTRPAPAAGAPKTSPHSHAAQQMARGAGQIDVQSSGVSFDRNNGTVTTAERVSFSMTQGSGSAVGATFDSENGHLTLLHAVKLTTYRGEDAVRIQAEHAEFDRGAQQCVLRSAKLEYRAGQADAGEARIGFREDGSAKHLDATNGFVLTTLNGGRLASPAAAMEFDEHNQPRHGHLEGGVTVESKRGSDAAQTENKIHGSSPTAELDFNTQGHLRHAHLERGVTFESEQTIGESAEAALTQRRTWRSPVADLGFRTFESAGRTQVELETIHGIGGVTLTSESKSSHGAMIPAKMQADEVMGKFDSGSVLRMIVGLGHASMEETTATGAVEFASGDRLTANFAQPTEIRSRGEDVRGQKAGRQAGVQNSGTGEVQTAQLDGHVVLLEQPAAKRGAPPQPPLRATAGKAVYEGIGEWLHLTGSSRGGDGPRIVNDGLELTAEKVDVSRQTGDAFAHGNVKATWSGPQNSEGHQNVVYQNGGMQGGSALGGDGPAHVISAEAQLSESTGEGIFRGHARLWQQANSIAAPEIVLNQHLQTLKAKTSDTADPVRAVLVSAGAPGGGLAHGPNGSWGTRAGQSTNSSVSVIRVRGGDLEYFDAEHRAVMHGGVAGAVVAEMGVATSTSDRVDLRLIPAGSGSGQAQVDRLTAVGHVVLLTAQGRRGTGEQLVYSGVTGDYVLTGTQGAPPRISDPEQGSVSGNTLIFHSRDDSVSIEGGGHETRTETAVPAAHGR